MNKIKYILLFVVIKSNYLDKDKVENLVMNFKNEMKSQFGLSRKSNKNNVYYFRPKVQIHIHKNVNNVW